MKLINFVAFCLTASLLTACDGLRQAPALTPLDGGSPMAAGRASQAMHGRSWMLPQAKDQDLLYVSDPGTGGVMVYTYNPPRYTFVGILSDAYQPLGECVDRQQQIFITNSGALGGAVTLVYDHGGTVPIRVLGDPVATPQACAVNPTNGDLAVTGGYDVPEFVIYAKGKGRPKVISAPDFGFVSFCAYDDAGNLFVDGLNAGRHHAILAELPAGSGTLTVLKVKNHIQPQGGMQWDGKHLAVGDPYDATIYRFKIEGDRAKEVGRTPLNGAYTIDDFFLTGSRVIDPSGSIEGRAGWVNFYRYPAGGDPGRNLPNFSSPYGVVVSRHA